MSTYTYVPSPIGDILLIAREDVIIRVAFENEGFNEVLNQYPGAVENAEHPALAAARSQLDEYFAGRRQTFDIQVASGPSSEFRRRVLDVIAEIPYGQTVTYSELATRVENPDAVRAVGTACGSNPVPLLVPCHRVVRTDGNTGSYLGGEKAKAWLLRHEREHAQQP